MNKTLALAGLSLVAGIAAFNTASANTVTGTIWETTTGIAQNAVPGNVPPSMTPGTAGATFSAPSNPLSFNPTDDPAVYTLGTWFASAGATATYFGGAAPTDALDATITNITGTVSVTTGEQFTVSHDDGVTLIIGGVTVIDDPGPTSAVDTTETYTGASGNQSFQLVYGECCGPPAKLVVDLPLNGATPELSTWGMMVAGFGGIGFLAFRRRRTAKAVVLSA